MSNSSMDASARTTSAFYMRCIVMHLLQQPRGARLELAQVHRGIDRQKIRVALKPAQQRRGWQRESSERERLGCRRGAHHAVLGTTYGSSSAAMSAALNASASTSWKPVAFSSPSAMAQLDANDASALEPSSV